MPRSFGTLLAIILMLSVVGLAIGWNMAERRLEAQKAFDATLLDRVEQLENRATRPTAIGRASPSMSPGASLQNPAQPASPMAGLSGVQQERDRQWQAAASTFAHESSNPRWGGPVESSLLNASRDPMMAAVDPPQQMDVACRSTQCRVRASFPSRSTAEDWAQIFIVGAGRSLPHTMMQVVPQTDGTTEVVIYGSP
jgi:hypothetical protein